MIDSIAQQAKDLAELKLMSKIKDTTPSIELALVKNHGNQVQNVDIINPFAEPFPHQKITNNNGQENSLATRLQSIFTIPPPRRPRQVSPAPNIEADSEAKVRIETDALMPSIYTTFNDYSSKRRRSDRKVLIKREAA